MKIQRLMKIQRFLLVGAAIVLASSAPAWAQRVEIQPRQVQPKIALGRGEVSLLTAEAIEKLKLSNEQKEKYTKIEGDYRDQVKVVQDKFRLDIQGLDRTKIREASEKQQVDSKKIRDDQLGKVEALLNAEQKTVFAQVKQDQPRPGAGGGGVRPQPIGGGIGQVLPAGVQQRLQLTDEQKKQIEAIQKEVETKIMKVLTDEQKKQLEQMKKGPIRILPVQPAQPNPRIQPAQPPAVPAPPAVEPRRQ
jgi:Spy/CpxP family protein refolding chaperone